MDCAGLAIIIEPHAAAVKSSRCPHVFFVSAESAARRLSSNSSVLLVGVLERLNPYQITESSARTLIHLLATEIVQVVFRRSQCLQFTLFFFILIPRVCP